MTAPTHRKLIIQESLLGGLYYADSYAFPRAEAAPFPLVVYVGGSVTNTVFDRRLHTEPTVILEAFIRASAGTPSSPVDLLVLPFPPPRLTPFGEGGQIPDAESADGVALLSDVNWRTVLRRKFLSAFATEIPPARGLPLPPALGFVGFSSGAYLAAGLALDLPRAPAMASLGGTGMAEAVKQSSAGACHGKHFAAFANDEDPLRPNAALFESYMRRRSISVKTSIRPGRHSFADYARNGLAEEAFQFVLTHL